VAGGLSRRARTGIQVGRALLEDPIQAWDWAQNGLEIVRGLGERRTETPSYTPEGDWLERLHALLGAEWPCPAAPDFSELWDDVASSLGSAGPGYGERYDSDASLGRALWCLVRHTKPTRVVETGVARGINSRVMLEALEANGAGHLYSIDLPPVLEEWRTQSRAAVPTGLRSRWTYLTGSSRRHLPRLAADLGALDLFVHDSLHSAANMRFEMTTMWPLLAHGGALVADDVESNGAFASFLAGSGAASVVAPQDFTKRGLFGVALKPASR